MTQHKLAARFEDVIGRLQRAGCEPTSTDEGTDASCPRCRQPSLLVSRIDGVTDSCLARCLAGCNTQQIARALDIPIPAPSTPAPSLSLAPETELANVVCLADVRPEPVEWLWPGRIPLGKLTIIEGDPGTGKSSLTLDLAARLTRGYALPDSPSQIEPASVLLLTAEDGIADTVRPRLEAAGADLKRVHVLRAIPECRRGMTVERLPSLPGDIPVIEATIERHGVRLLVIDPIAAFLSSDIDGYRDTDVRRALAPLAEMAGRTGAAVVIVRHLNKGQNANALYRGGGSIAMTGAARSVMLVAKHPTESGVCVLAPVKNNLAARQSALAFRLATVGQVARVEWLGTAPYEADDLLAAQVSAGNLSGVKRAEALLREMLSEGPVKVQAVEQAAKEAGVSERTLARARKSMGAQVKRVGKLGAGGHWELTLPDGADREEAGKSANLPLLENVAALDDFGTLSRLSLSKSAKYS